MDEGQPERFPLTDIVLHCGEWARDEVEEISELIAAGHTWLARFRRKELEVSL